MAHFVTRIVTFYPYFVARLYNLGTTGYYNFAKDSENCYFLQTFYTLKDIMCHKRDKLYLNAYNKGYYDLNKIILQLIQINYIYKKNAMQTPIQKIIEGLQKLKKFADQYDERGIDWCIDHILENEYLKEEKEIIINAHRAGKYDHTIHPYRISSSENYFDNQFYKML